MASSVGNVAMTVDMTLDQVRIVNIQPGDRLVVTVPGHLNMAEYDKMKHELSKFFQGTPAIILMGGVELSVIRGEDGEL